MIAKRKLCMNKLLHFVFFVKTWLHITAKHVTVIFVNFALLINIQIRSIYQRSGYATNKENTNEIHFSMLRKH